MRVLCLHTNPLPHTPNAVSDQDRQITKVIAGPRHCAAIDSAGQVLTWGYNGGWYEGGGQLGHGDTNSLDTPTYVEAFTAHGAKCKDVSLGSQHTLFLTADGEVLSCGHGEHGRLGTGDLGNVETPQTVETLLQDNIVQIAAGGSHSLVLSDTGKIYAWGKNDSGQLGIKDTMIDMNSLEPYPLALPSNAFLLPSISTSVSTNSESLEVPDEPIWISARGKRSLCVTKSGDLYMWGFKLAHYPTKVDRSQFGDLRITKAYLAGEKHWAVLVVTEDGSLWSMGNPKSMLLGYDAGSSFLTQKVNVPAHKIGEGLWDRREVRGVHVGPAHVGVVVDMA